MSEPEQPDVPAPAEPQPVKRQKVRPIHAVLFVLLFTGTVLLADFARDGGFHRDGFERVRPDERGQVVLSVGDLPPSEVRFYRFLNAGNQEVKFFVARDLNREVHVAFDTNELCAKLKRGYRHEGDWVVCNKCDKAFELTEVNAGGGGCKPITLHHRLEGDRLILAENDILAGWRYFR